MTDAYAGLNVQKGDDEPANKASSPDKSLIHSMSWLYDLIFDKSIARLRSSVTENGRDIIDR